MNVIGFRVLEIGARNAASRSNEGNGIINKHWTDVDASHTTEDNEKTRTDGKCI